MKNIKLNAAIFLACLLPIFSHAEERKHGVEEIYMPPGVARSTAPPLAGAALQANTTSKFRALFDAADTAKSGSISAAQAQQAGWGYVVNNFKLIDSRNTGRVSFDDILDFMRTKGAHI